MPVLPEIANEIILPNMFQVTQVFPDEKIKDIRATVMNELENDSIKGSFKAGDSVAILIGSRGIAGLQEVVKTTIDWMLNLELNPFIVPSMGSHGGGDAGEQRAIIEGFGITEEYMGIRIISSMETVLIGKTQTNVAVFGDKNACNADHIVPIARVKAHTDFRGSIESGLCKMLTIGLGKHKGCSILHKEGISVFPELIPEAASVVLREKSIPFGICIIENAHDHVNKIKAVKGSDILQKEPKLLKYSKSLMPRLFFDDIDVLVIEKIGKEISGAGMDPNIIGRLCGAQVSGYQGPRITRIVVNGISDASYGNAVGMGDADFCTRELFERIDFVSTYANCIASGFPEVGKIPIIMDTEEEALKAAILTCSKVDAKGARVVRIKDTLHLINIEVSESLLRECRENKNIIINGEISC